MRVYWLATRSLPWLLLWLLLTQPLQAAPDDVQAITSTTEETIGLLVESVGGWTLKKAGLQARDVLLTWKRLPNPPANPDPAEGILASYFDWQELLNEQAPRGTVILRGRRGAENKDFIVAPGLWEAEVRPILPEALEKIFKQGQDQLVAGDLDRTIETWQALLDHVPATHSRDLRAWILLKVGEVWGEKADWDKVLTLARKAIEAAETAQAQIAAWEASGNANERLNKLGAAHEDASHALGIRENLEPISLGSASGLSLLAAIEWERGEVESARNNFHRALQIQERLAPKSLPVATGLNNLGSIARSLGELDRAADFNQRAIQIKQQLAPNSLTLAVSLNNFATIAVDRWDLDSAYDAFIKALRICEQLDPESLTVAQIINNLGNVAQGRKEFGRAHEHYLRALQIQKNLTPESLDLANTLSNLGSLAWEQGMLDDARAYYLQSLQMRQKISPESLSVARVLNNLGAVARDSGDFDRALDYFHKAMEMRERLAPRSLETSSTLNNIGNIKQARKEFKEAKYFYTRSLQIEMQFAPQGKGVAESLNHLGMIAREEGDLSAAYSYYSRALDALEHQFVKLGGSYNVQGGFRSTYVDFYFDVIDLLLSQSRRSEAFQIMERSRAQTFLTMLSERDLAFSADIPEALDHERRRLAVLYDRTVKRLASLDPRKSAEHIETVRTELRRLEGEAGDIEASIRKASPRLAALKYPQPFGTAEAQQTLDPGTLMLSYIVGKEKTALFALSPSGDLEVKILPLGGKALRSQVRQLLSLIRESRVDSSIGKQRQLQLRKASQDLYAALLGPVEERIAASERLLILPDGPLHVLPFGALIHGDDGQYLATWKPLHIALSATVFAELKQRRQGNAPQAPVQLAAFGDPVYPQSLKKKGDALDDSLRGDPTVRSVSERGLFDWQPLPYTRREVEGISRLFPDGAAKTFLGPEALEDKVKGLDPKTRILHIAAHGYTDEHLPSSSFLALTIPEDTGSDAVTPQRDNGLLQVWEIFERVRLDADLVVLSACETGLGEEQGGEGLIGLTRAFQYAGARTVMASLWNVQDRATSELMIRFYKHLRAGLPKDEALRQAQIELIRGPIEVINEKGEKILMDASAPYYWAGFQLYGDWQ